MKNYYAVVGSWGMGDVPKGLTVYRYSEETAELTDMERYDEKVSAGQLCYDAKRRVLYVADEVDNHPGEMGGGGFVRAYRVAGDGKLTFINEACVLMGKPAYITLTPEGDYILAACHSSRGFVTKAVHDSKGSWTSTVVYDDAGLTLVRVNADGSLGEVADVAIHEGLTDVRAQVHSHPHSVIGAPDGSVYYVCDKGLDRLYGYRVNHERGKLIPLGVTEMDYATAPRYGAFHPEKNVFYENNETGNKVWAFSFDAKNGALSVINTVETGLNEEGKGQIMPSDIAVHPNGKYLYSANRSIRNIAIFDIAEDGSIALRESFDTELPVRGFCISPDGRFMLAACERASLVKVFKIGEDGALSDTGKSYEAASSSCVTIIEV